MTITCSFDLNLTSIEWLYNDEVITSSVASQLDLTFSPVNDTINNRQYTCRVTTPYGDQEEDITIRVQGSNSILSLDILVSLYYFIIFAVPSTSIVTSISALGPPVAGYNFTITCTVSITDGLTEIPSLTWIDSSGQALNSTGDFTVHEQMTFGHSSIRALYFDPLRTSDEGTYSCVVTLSSPALAAPLNSSATYLIDAEQSKLLFDIYLL